MPTDLRSPPAGLPPAGRAESLRARAIEVARNRLIATGLVFLCAFLVMAGRLVDLTLFGRESKPAAAASDTKRTVGRADIVDRNGVILATSIPIASLYADPKEILDPDAAVRDLVTLFPDLDRRALREKLTSHGRFVWIRRGLTPETQEAVNRLGIPGLSFVTERRRFYPAGRLASHIVGFTDVDGHGISGVEQSFDQVLADGNVLRLSIDSRVQGILRSALAQAVSEFRAIGAAGMVMDANTGEVIAMVSLPDFDPNEPVIDSKDEARFNRVTKGVYEMGSTFKVFTLASALDAGTTNMQRSYNASRPIHIGRHTISDYHARNRWLTVPEVLIHSSNVGAALIAMEGGTARQRQYMQKFGMLSRPPIELPEVGVPLVPDPWRDINTMTIAFGHGLAVTPLHLVSGVAAIVNGGVLRPATLQVVDPDAVGQGRTVISQRASQQMRQMMRMVVTEGTGGKADVPGYLVGGKTGTAEKQVHGRYQQNARVASFVGAFPMDSPRFVVLVMLDEPKGNRSTFNYATGGWVAAPVVGTVVREIAPLFGILPRAAEAADGARKKQQAAAARPSQPPAKQATGQVRNKQVAAR